MYKNRIYWITASTLAVPEHKSLAFKDSKNVLYFFNVPSHTVVTKSTHSDVQRPKIIPTYIPSAL